MSHKISIEIASFLIRYSGVPILIRNFYARRKVSIIKYHDPSPDILDRHLEYISRRYRFIALGTLVDAMRARDWSLIPPKSMVLTIDDGNRRNFELLEVFRKYKVTPTIYLCTQIAGTKRQFWWKKLDRRSVDLVRKMRDEERLDYLRRKAGYDPAQEISDDERQSLSEEEIRLMKDTVDFQSHSRFHPILTACSDDECRKEIFLSKQEVEQITGKPCRHFSYPNGDYTSREIDYLREAGYFSARSLDAGWNDLNTDPYTLKITGVTDDASINLLAAQLSGITGFLRNLVKGSPTGRQEPSRIPT